MALKEPTGDGYHLDEFNGFRSLEVRVTDQQAVRVFRALGNPTRYRIVQLLVRRDEVACRELVRYFRLSGPALSHHFRVLQECGLLRVRKDGPYHYFRLNRAVLRQALSRLRGWETD